MVLWAASVFYPEKFADVDIISYFHDFFQQWYGMDLSEEEINDIIDG